MNCFFFGWIVLIIAGLAFDLKAYGIASVAFVFGVLNIISGIYLETHRP